MKKIISILLVVLTIFSFSTVAFAEGEAATYTVYFVYNTAEGEKTEMFEVAYGTDLDEVAPKVESYVHPNDNTQLVKFDYWYSDFTGSEILIDLPTYTERDGDVDGIRFIAKQIFVDNDFKNQTQEKFDEVMDNFFPNGNPLENMGDFFTTVVELFKKWFSLFIFYVMSFVG